MMVTKKINVSGGDLPDGYKVKIALTIDYTDATVEELVPPASRSHVITMQGKYRKLSTKELNQLAIDGVTIKSADVTSAAPVMDLRTALKAIGRTDEEIELIMSNQSIAMSVMDDMTEGK